MRAITFQADQADPVQVTGLIDHVVAHFGRLDILVNNAAIFALGEVTDLQRDEAAFERLIAVNLASVAVGVRAAARVMGEGGRIISVGSWLASRTGRPGIADYSATKAAIVFLASPAASYITCATLTVDGGSTRSHLSSASAWQNAARLWISSVGPGVPVPLAPFVWALSTASLAWDRTGCSLSSSSPWAS